jgi:hypothetical protein
MSGIAFVADVHLANHRLHGGPMQAGLNRRCLETLSVLERAKVRALDEGCTTLVVLGDLFDSSRPEPQVIAAAQAALADIDCYVLMGNHDMVSTADGDHALGPLDGHQRITVIAKPGVVQVGEVDLLMVPFKPGEAAKWAPESWAEAARGVRPGRRSHVVCLHLGLIDEKTPPWLRASPDALPVEAVDDLCGAHGGTHVVAGNWHSRKRWGDVMQVGTLVPTGWDNPGVDGYGTLAIFDKGKLRHVELPGPRFVKLKVGEALPSAKRGQLYLRVVALPEQFEETRAHVASLVNQGVLTAGEVVPDEVEVEVATRAAARAAASRETLDESLVAYVDEMPLVDGVSRDAVLARCREFLK